MPASIRAFPPKAITTFVAAEGVAFGMSVCGTILSNTPFKISVYFTKPKKSAQSGIAATERIVVAAARSAA